MDRASPLDDRNGSSAIVQNPVWIKLFMLNGAHTAPLLLKFIQNKNHAQVIVLIEAGTALSHTVWVEEKNMTLARYIVREAPDMLETVIQAINQLEKGKFANLIVAAIDAGKTEIARRLVKAFLAHKNPHVEYIEDIVPSIYLYPHS